MAGTERDDWALAQMRARKRQEAEPQWKAEHPLVAAPPARPAAPPPRPATSSPPVRPSSLEVEPGAFTPRALVGVILIVAGITGLVLYQFVPVVADTFADESYDRDEWSEDLRGFSYVQDAVQGPFTWYIWVIVAGALLVAATLAPLPPGLRLTGQGISLGLGALFGYLIVLDAARLFGIYFGGLLGEPSLRIHLHVGAYLDLIMGVGILGATLWSLRSVFAAVPKPPAAMGRRLIRDLPLGIAGVILIGLVLFAAVPLTYLGDSGDEGEWITFGSLEVFRGFAPFGSSELADASDDYDLAVGFLWAVLWLAIAAGVALRLEAVGPLPLLWRGIGQTLTIAGIPLLIGTVFLLLAFIGLWGSDDVGPTWNIAPILVYGIVIALYIVFVMRETVPFLRDVTVRVEPHRRPPA